MGRGKRRESREKRDWIPSRNPNSRPELIKFRKSCLGVLPIKLFDLFLSRTSLNSVIRSCLFQFSSYYFFKWGSRKNEIHFNTLIRSRAVVLLSSERRAAREKVKLCTPLTRAFDLLWPKRKIRVFSQSKSSLFYPSFSGVAQVPAERDSIPGGYSWEILLGTVPSGSPTDPISGNAFDGKRRKKRGWPNDLTIIYYVCHHQFDYNANQNISWDTFQIRIDSFFFIHLELKRQIRLYSKTIPDSIPKRRKKQTI